MSNDLTGLAAGLFAGYQIYNSEQKKKSEGEEKLYQRGRQAKQDELAQQQFGLQKDQFGETQRRNLADESRNLAKDAFEQDKFNKEYEFEGKKWADQAGIRGAQEANLRAAAAASKANADANKAVKTALERQRDEQLKDQEDAENLVKLAAKVKATKRFYDPATAESLFVLSKSANPTASGIPFRPPAKTDILNAIEAKYGDSIRKNVGNPIGKVHGELVAKGIMPDSILEDIRPVDFVANKKNNKGVIMVEATIRTKDGLVKVVEPITKFRSFADDDEIKELDLDEEAQSIPAMLALHQELQSAGINAENVPALLNEIAGLALSKDPRKSAALQALGIDLGQTQASKYAEIGRMARIISTEDGLPYDQAFQIAIEQYNAGLAGQTQGGIQAPGYNGAPNIGITDPSKQGSLQPGQSVQLGEFKVTAIPTPTQ